MLVCKVIGVSLFLDRLKVYSALLSCAAKVYFGCSNDKFGGCGSVYSLHTMASADSKQQPKPECNGYECVPGLYAQEAIDLLKQFYSRGNDKGMLCDTMQSHSFCTHSLLVFAHWYST